MKKLTMKQNLSDILESLNKVICSDQLTSKHNIILLEAFNIIKNVEEDVR